jgi:hypothetical protein
MTQVNVRKHTDEELRDMCLTFETNNRISESWLKAKSVPVTKANLERFISSRCAWLMMEEIEEELSAIRKGFSNAGIGLEFVSLTPRSLKGMIEGQSMFTLNQWHAALIFDLNTELLEGWFFKVSVYNTL